MLICHIWFTVITYRFWLKNLFGQYRSHLPVERTTYHSLGFMRVSVGILLGKSDVSCIKYYFRGAEKTRSRMHCFESVNCFMDARADKSCESTDNAAWAPNGPIESILLYTRRLRSALAPAPEALLGIFGFPEVLGVMLVRLFLFTCFSSS